MGRNRPDEGLGEDGVDGVLVWFSTVCCGKYLQQKLTVHGVGGRGVEPIQVGAQHGRCTVCASPVDGGEW